MPFPVLEFSYQDNQLTFNLMYNMSCPSIVELCKDYTPEILRSVTDAILSYYSNNPNSEITLYTSKYPEISPPSDGTSSTPIQIIDI